MVRAFLHPQPVPPNLAPPVYSVQGKGRYLSQGELLGRRTDAGSEFSSKKIYLIDTMAYVFRAFHALPPMSNAKGLPTNAVLGFCRMVLKLKKTFHPAYIACVNDASGPTFREEIFPEYKANRKEPDPDLVPQFDLCRRAATEAFNLPLLELRGFEADDLIATLARKFVAQGYETVIVSSDKDLMQLVGDKVTMWDPMKDRVIGREQVIERFGVPPEQVTDVQALIGDSTDNIPGVKGVGEKTAPGLIQKYGSVENLLAHLDELDKKALRDRLDTGRQMAVLSKKLATCRDDVPIQVAPEDLVSREPDPEKMTLFFREMDFTALIREMSSEEQYQGFRRDQYETILDEEALGRVLDEIRAAGLVAFDTETTSLNELEAELVGVSLATKPGHAWYAPVAHRYLGAPVQIPRDRAVSLLKPLLEDPDITKIGQNVKYDRRIMLRYGVQCCGFTWDSMLASYVIDPGRRSHGLDQLAFDFLKHRMLSYAEVTGTGKNQVSFDQVDVKRATEYSGEDADAVIRLYQQLNPRLESEGVANLFCQIEMPLVDVLVDMEERGVLVDTGKLKVMSREYGDRMAKLLREIYKHAGTEFNVDSPKQLSGILFEKLKLPPSKKTKTGYSTDQEVLEKLADEHPMPRLLLDYRGLAKLKSTYIDALPQMVNAKTGRIHTSFNQAVAETGRLSSSDPNLQNIPARTNDGRRIREAFVAPPGHQLISADYSQVELRILAHVTGDEALLAAYREGTDIHRLTASEVFGVTPEAVTREQRSAGKTINFSVIYGIGAMSLGKSLGVSPGEAQKYIDAYFRRYPGVNVFFDRTVEEARKQGFVTTLLGRKRFLPTLTSKNFQERSFAERAACNTVIQGTAADIIKVAMIELFRRLPMEGLATRMILQVHDELLFEAPEKELGAAQKLIPEVMSSVVKLDVPLEVDTKAALNWAAAH